MKKFISILLVSTGLASNVNAQNYVAPSGSDFDNAKVTTYVEDDLNNFMDIPSTLACLLQNGGVGSAGFANRTWKAVIPESKCFNPNWDGNITIIYQTQRVSNSSPQEVIGWMELESNNIAKYIFSGAISATAAEAPPYGTFDLRFYAPYDAANGFAFTGGSIPQTPFDMAIASLSESSDSTKLELTSSRSRTAPALNKQQVKMELKNNGDDIKVVALQQRATQNGTQVDGVSAISHDGKVLARLFDANGSPKLGPGNTPLATCKARDLVFNRPYVSKLYNFSDGSEVKLTNPSIEINFVNANGNKENFGRGRIEANTYWFKNRTRGSLAEKTFSVVDAVTDAPMTAVWAPGIISNVEQITQTLSVGDKFIRGDKTVVFDGVGLEYSDISGVSNNNIEVVNGKNYMHIPLQGQFVRAKDLLNSDVLITPKLVSGTYSNHEIESVAKAQVLSPMSAANDILSGNSLTRLVCVNDFDCPHMLPNTTSPFGNPDLSIFHNNNNKIEVSGSLQQDLWYPRKAANTANSKRAHHYLLTPLDSPTGTLPATLYYDLDADGSLDAEDKPLITYLQHREKKMNADGSTSPDDTWFSLATGPGTSINSQVETATTGAANTTKNNLYTGLYLVKYDDFVNNGCDGVASSGAPDTSFMGCGTRFHFKSGARRWEQRFFLKDNNGFIEQDPGLPIKYKINKLQDMNNGFNAAVAARGGFRVTTTYNQGDYNEMTSTKCTTNGGCAVDLGPEGLHNTTFAFTHAGRELYPQPGGFVKFGLLDQSNSWMPALAPKDGTIFSNAVDENIKYVMKNTDIGQKLANLAMTECTNDSDVNFSGLSDPVMSGFTYGDLPSLSIAGQLAGMPVWDDIPEAAATATGCYFQNGEKIGICN